MKAYALVSLLLMSALSMPAYASGYGGISCSRATNSMTCMVCNCYFEAGIEKFKGKVAVGRTVMTRVYSDQYNDHVCNVVYQNAQFSWTQDGKSDRLPRSKEYGYSEVQECVTASAQAFQQGPNGYTHYHANYVHPKWANSGKGCMYKTTIGHHLFYDCFKWGILAAQLWQVRIAAGLSKSPAPAILAVNDVEPDPSASVHLAAQEIAPVPAPRPYFRQVVAEAPVPMPLPSFRRPVVNGQESVAHAIDGLTPEGQAELDGMAAELDAVHEQVKRGEVPH